MHYLPIMNFELLKQVCMWSFLPLKKHQLSKFAKIYSHGSFRYDPHACGLHGGDCGWHARSIRITSNAWDRDFGTTPMCKLWGWPYILTGQCWCRRREPRVPNKLCGSTRLGQCPMHQPIPSEQCKEVSGPTFSLDKSIENKKCRCLKHKQCDKFRAIYTHRDGGWCKCPMLQTAHGGYGITIANEACNSKGRRETKFRPSTASSGYTPALGEDISVWLQFSTWFNPLRDRLLYLRILNPMFDAKFPQVIEAQR